jgi:ParB-like chromosome segregation protein Spo0J
MNNPMEVFMITTTKIKLDNLLLNTENFRYETVNDQKEAINKILEDKTKKIINLAQHILQNGLNPNKKVQIFPSAHEVSKYIILDGNRRVVALKLLKNPNLIDDPLIRKRFQTLKDNYPGKLIDELDCNIYDKPEEDYEWIKLEHAGQIEGIGTVDWNSQQIDRFEEKVEGESSIALQAINFLKKSATITEEIKAKLPNLHITNLDRLLSDPDVRSLLGIEIDNGVLRSVINEEETGKGLAQLTKDLLDPTFSVREIYTKEDRKAYLEKFPSENRPDLGKKADKPWLLTDTKPAPPSKKKAPSSKERKHLIPKSCILKINNPKVNSIYDELQRLDVNKFTNAVAVTFRVFIELSIDCYIDANMSKSATAKKKFREKVSDVAQHLINVKSADKNICKGIMTAVQNKNDILGIDTWHAYVHNPHFSPTPQNLLITWDNLQKFVEILWSNVS